MCISGTYLYTDVIHQSCSDILNLVGISNPAACGTALWVLLSEFLPISCTYIYPSDTHSHLNGKNRTHRDELGVYRYYIGGKSGLLQIILI
jgi:hypothetical protein